MDEGGNRMVVRNKCQRYAEFIIPGNEFFCAVEGIEYPERVPL